MKIALLALLALASCCQAGLSLERERRIVDAIYVAEGGSGTHHPYGILSVKTSDPRKVCATTVRHKYAQWQAAGSKGDFLNYLADRYCPPSADPVGNRNWKKNVRRLTK